MDTLKEMWQQVQPFVCSTPSICVLGVLLGVSLVKKLISLAITIAVIIALVLLLRATGFGMDDVQGMMQGMADYAHTF